LSGLRIVKQDALWTPARRSATPCRAVPASSAGRRRVAWPKSGRCG